MDTPTPASFRRIAIGEDAPDAVTVAIERNGDADVVAAVWWPARGDVDADEAAYPSVPAALAAAEAARVLHRFDEVVVMLQQDELWDQVWGTLRQGSASLSDDEAFELARATEASRDA